MKSNMHRLTTLLILLLCGLLTNAQQQPATPYGSNAAAGKSITLNGVRHYYEAYGSGRPMLLIHGNRTATKGWAATIAHFSKSYRVYSVDSRGRGQSELGPDTLRFEQMASDMAAFIDVMKLDSVDIVGKSDGAIVALLMGIHHPAHIRKIVAFAPNVQPDTTALFPKTLASISAERIAAEVKLANGDRTQNWTVEQQRLRLDEFQPHISAEELSRIRVPVMIMSCDRDVIRPEHILWIYSHIPKAHLCILPGETHHIVAQNPELFNRMTELFLSRPFVPDGARYE